MKFFDILQSFQLSTLQWIGICFAVFLLGISKSGIKGIGVLLVLILAFVFGEKASTGILLPMLIAADIMAVTYYNRHANWGFIKKLMPWMVIGVLVGVWLGNDISEALFKKIMAVIIIFSVFVMFLTERNKSTKVPNNPIFSISAGFFSGFSTMIGNLAGPISDVYFLAMRLPKNEFIGTGAWLFFIINVFKFPFHFFVWKTITKETLILNVALFPVILLSFLAGIWIVKQISNVNYRRFVFVVTILGGFIMLFR